MKIRLAATCGAARNGRAGAAQVTGSDVRGSVALLQPLVVTQLDERLQGSDLDNTRPVTITLSEPTPITDLLLMLVRDTRLSVVPDPDVQGRSEAS